MRREIIAGGEATVSDLPNGMVKVVFDDGEVVFAVPSHPAPQDLAENEKTSARLLLQEDWFHLEIAPGVDCSKPGIYRWTIKGGVSDEVYIGKYKHFNRPKLDYGRNVTHLRNGQSYRKSNPDGFRKIHEALANAVQEGHQITLTILENPSRADINRRERELIQEYGTLNG